MMNEWSAARQRVQDVKAKNAEEGEKMSKEITSVSIPHKITVNTMYFYLLCLFKPLS